MLLEKESKSYLLIKVLVFLRRNDWFQSLIENFVITLLMAFQKTGFSNVILKT